MRRKKPTTYNLQPTTWLAGYTLIELMVVVALIGLVMGGGAVAYGTFQKRQTVVTAGKQLLVDLHQAQNKMNSGIKTATGCSNARLTGYTIRVLSSAKYQYEVMEKFATNCANGGTSSTKVVKTIPLPSSLTFQNAFSLTFLGLSGGADLSTSPELTIRLCNNGCGSGAVIYAAKVNKAGLITDLGTQ